MLPTQFSDHKEALLGKVNCEFIETNKNKEESKIKNEEEFEKVPYEGTANKLLHNYINSSKLVYDKGNVKPEDRKEFGIKPIQNANKRNEYLGKIVNPQSESINTQKLLVNVEQDKTNECNKADRI